VGLVGLAALGYAVYWFYLENEASAGMSGKSFYEMCWEYRSKRVGLTTPQPSNPYQAAQWKNCELVVLRGIYGEGMIFGGGGTGDGAERLARACPNLWSEIPVGGAFYLYVQDTESAGGVSGVASFLPATWSVESWAKTRWPRCSSERERQGYSKKVEKNPGIFGWEKPCPKCFE
jgi:hypothetical protein